VKTRFFLSVALMCIFLFSALLVIDKKYESRSLFIEMQKQEKMLDGFEVEWGQLQLELTMLTEENRVESMAKNKLKLIMPSREKIIYLKP
jgi:cell division protein FtsL